MNNFIFLVKDCYKRKILLVTHLPSKAKDLLKKGVKIQIWHKDKLLQTVYQKDNWIMDSFIELKENSQDKEKAKSKIENYKNDLTKQQYNVLIGLVNSGDTNGAIKGLYKILRRNKAHF